LKEKIVKLPKYLTEKQIKQVENWLSRKKDQKYHTCPWAIGKTGRLGSMEKACYEKGGRDRCARWFPTLSEKRGWKETEYKLCPCSLLTPKYVVRRARKFVNEFHLQRKEQEEIRKDFLGIRVREIGG